MDTQNRNAHSLKIAMVTETYLPEVNGVANTLGRMVKGLLKQGHTIHLIRPRQHKQDCAANEEQYRETLVSCMPIPGYKELKFGLPAKRALMSLWTKQRPDIVNISTEGPLGWSALSAAKKLNIPVSSSFHTNFHNYSQHYHIGLLQKPIATYLRHFHNLAACTMVPTGSLRQQLESKGYKNVLVVSRGVDTELFHPSKRSSELRTSWNATDETPVVMLVSRIAPEKNLHLVIQAFDHMRTINPLAVLVIVGDGPSRPELEKQNPHVVFAGMQTGEALAKHYASGDIFLHASMTETYGNVTMEAMASGLATVSFNYAAANQHIQHDVNGLLAPFADNDAFIKQSVNLISNMEQVQRIRLAAQETTDGLSWDKVINVMESVLFETISKHGSRQTQPELFSAID